MRLNGPLPRLRKSVPPFAAIPIQYRPVVLLAAWCQLRRGEILRPRAPTHRRGGGVADARTGVGELGPPKSDAGRRSVAIPPQILAMIENHLKAVGPEPDAWLFPGENGMPVSPRTLDRIWSRARKAIDRPDLRFHDVRHSGLTWSAASGASVAEIMRRGGRSSPAAALRYQHATERDNVLANRLAALAGKRKAVSPKSVENLTDKRRTKVAGDDSSKDSTDATITPLTSHDTEQSQRGSNPCLHLERAIEPVYRVDRMCSHPVQLGSPFIPSSSVIPRLAESSSKTSSKDRQVAATGRRIPAVGLRFLVLE